MDHRIPSLLHDDLINLIRFSASISLSPFPYHTRIPLSLVTLESSNDAAIGQLVAALVGTDDELGLLALSAGLLGTSGASLVLCALLVCGESRLARDSFLSGHSFGHGELDSGLQGGLVLLLLGGVDTLSLEVSGFSTAVASSVLATLFALLEGLDLGLANGPTLEEGLMPGLALGSLISGLGGALLLQVANLVAIVASLGIDTVAVADSDGLAASAAGNGCRADDDLLLILLGRGGGSGALVQDGRGVGRNNRLDDGGSGTLRKRPGISDGVVADSDADGVVSALVGAGAVVVGHGGPGGVDRSGSSRHDDCR